MFQELPHQTVHLRDFPGGSWILDIGGGGEGAIGLLKGARVVAIDTSKRELQETDNWALKIVMDACDLKFLDRSFDTVTAFFSMMYIQPDSWPEVFGEVRRVLKKGGDFMLWDATLPEHSEKEYLLVPLTIAFPDGTTRETGYGCRPHRQSIEDFLQLAKDQGFRVVSREEEDLVFFLHIRKD